MKYEIKEVPANVKLFVQEYIASKTTLYDAFKPEIMIKEICESQFEYWRLIFRKHIPVIELAKEEYPKDWWQAFRNRWFPNWWLKKHPVEYRKISLDMAVNCAIPKNYGTRFILAINDGLIPSGDLDDLRDRE